MYGIDAPVGDRLRFMGTFGVVCLPHGSGLRRHQPQVPLSRMNAGSGIPAGCRACAPLRQNAR
jgi:hypothetical protein